MRFAVRFVFALCLFAACTFAWPQQDSGTASKDTVSKDTASSDAVDKDDVSKYKLGTGDVISITVFGEDDLKVSHVRLTDAGTISYPVLGELQVRGRTVGEIEKMITDGLRGRYLVNPRVSVNIDEYRPFFINGQIKNGGSFPYQPGLTVRKAVTIAGGFTERASKSSITVVRDGDESHTPVKVDLDAPIHPGDIITVDESFF